ncbi:LysM peptidoglycan-binding domain-containing protein [Wukongibacter baidiensis]|uniref:LysM peptidoglycan-binding domain-containing protein n=1 Tax=Wukongibacter baidiensis TaxID=1723361 RepID=UPI003D7FD3C9
MRHRKLEPRKPEKCYKHSASQYTVKRGDTLYSIASDFGISVHDLAMNNVHIPNPRYLITGDVLCIPKKTALCSFIYPTKATPKNSYAVISRLNGITCIVNLPYVRNFGDEFVCYHCYAVDLNEFRYVELTHISKNPSIWMGEIREMNLNPQTRIIISAVKENEIHKPPGDLILFDSK